MGSQNELVAVIELQATINQDKLKEAKRQLEAAFSSIKVTPVLSKESINKIKSDLQLLSESKITPSVHLQDVQKASADIKAKLKEATTAGVSSGLSGADTSKITAKTKESAEQVGKEFQKAAEQISGSMSKSLDEASKKAKAVNKELASGSQGGASDFKKLGGDLAKSLGVAAMGVAVLQESIQSAVALVKSVIDPVQQVIVDVFSRLAPLFKTLLTPITTAIQPLMDILVDVGAIIIDTLSPIIKAISDIFRQILKPFISLIDTFLPVLSKLLTSFMPLITQLATVVVQLLPITKLLELVAGGIERIMPFLQGIISGLTQVIDKVTSLTGGFISKLFGETKRAASEALPPVSTLKKTIEELNAKEFLTQEQEQQFNKAIEQIEKQIIAQEKELSVKLKQYGADSLVVKTRRRELEELKLQVSEYKKANALRSAGNSEEQKRTEVITKQTTVYKEQRKYVYDVVSSLERIYKITENPLVFDFASVQELNDVLLQVNNEFVELQEQFFNATIKFNFDKGASTTLEKFKKDVKSFYEAQGLSGIELDLKVLTQLIGNSEQLKLSQKELNDLTQEQLDLQGLLLDKYDVTAKKRDSAIKSIRNSSQELNKVLQDFTAMSDYSTKYEALILQQRQFAEETKELEKYLKSQTDLFSDNEVVKELEIRNNLLADITAKTTEKIIKEQTEQQAAFANTLRDTYSKVVEYKFEVQSELGRFISGGFNVSEYLSPGIIALNNELKTIKTTIEQASQALEEVGDLESLYTQLRTTDNEAERLSIEAKITKYKELSTVIAESTVKLSNVQSEVSKRSEATLKQITGVTSEIVNGLLGSLEAYKLKQREIYKTYSEQKEDFYSDKTILENNLAAGLLSYEEYYAKLNELELVRVRAQRDSARELEAIHSEMLRNMLQSIVDTAIDTISAYYIETITKLLLASAEGAGTLNFAKVIAAAVATASIAGVANLAKGQLMSLLGHEAGGEIKPASGDVKGKEDALRWLSYGEFVVNKKSATKYADVLHDINAGSYSSTSSNKELVSEMQLIRKELAELRATDLKRNINIKSYVNSNPNGIIRAIKYKNTTAGAYN